MKTLLTVISITLFSLSLFSQNPIIKEEYFEKDNNQWKKVSIVDRAFDNQGILTTEKRSYFDTFLDKWIPQTETWFNQIGNITRIRRHFFISVDLGFYIEETRRTYDELNRLLTTETFVKDNDDAEFQLFLREERTYFQDGSYLLKSYNKGNPSEEDLVFRGVNLFVAHENGDVIQAAYSERENEPIERLRNRIRITYTTLENGNEQRLIERMTCPGVFGCENFQFDRQETFNTEGQLIYSIFGSVTSSFRRISTIEYQENQTIYTNENFSRRGNLPTQSLFSRDITTIDTAGNILSRKRFEPFSIEDRQSIYEDGQIMQSIFSFTRKDSTGLNVFRDTINYQYQYYCDELVQEQVENFGRSQNRVTYSYLYPADCGANTDIGNIEIFPNPVTNTINVATTAFINGTYDLAIYDNQGRFIRSMTNSRGEIQSIEVGDLPNGVYYLSIPQNGKRTTQSFVIQK